MQPIQVQSAYQSERQGHAAALVCALIMGGLAVYGFAAGQAVVPTSNGRLILSGTAAYWAAAGQVLLALGLCSVPCWKAGLSRGTVFGALNLILGALLVWVGTLLNNP
jgi:hypothetical protein